MVSQVYYYPGLPCHRQLGRVRLLRIKQPPKGKLSILPVPGPLRRRLGDGKAPENKAFIFVDPWHGRWLKVEESGLEWITNSLTAYGHATFFATLRRRVPSYHR